MEMAYLAYIFANASRAGLLTGRVLIGRDLSHGVILGDPSVSRLHAWIDPVNNLGAWVITDAGSNAGTFVNGEKINRRELRDGDEIRIGTVRISFHAAELLPGDATPVEMSAPDGIAKTTGILFDCPSCGAPLWVASNMAGKRGLCRHCKKPVTVPFPVSDQAPVPEPAGSAIAAENSPKNKPLPRCAVCHSSIESADQMTECPECAMHFHNECWRENYGCSSYGCGQVNILNPQTPEMQSVNSETNVVTPEVPLTEATPRSSSAPGETVALAASVVATVLGTVAFGVPAALVAIWSIVSMARGARKSAMLVTALLISLAGIAAGLIISDICYFNARHLPFEIR